MADDRPLHEVVLDIVVYAPIGLAVAAAEELPRLTELGRSRVTTQVRSAHAIGRLAVRQVQRRLGGPAAGRSSGGGPFREDRLSDVPGPSSSLADGDELVDDPDAPPWAAPSRPRAGSSNGSRAGDVTEQATQAAAAEPPEAAPSTSLPDAGSLAIPGYDSLAASQVVQRLSSLDADELEAVRRYESATRRRRTILHRIAQLTAAGGRASA